MNSARKHYSWKTWSTTAAWKKKKKGKRIKKKHGRANAQSKHSLNEPIISSTLNTIHPLVLMHLLQNDHKNNAHHLVFHSFLPQKKGMQKMRQASSPCDIHPTGGRQGRNLICINKDKSPHQQGIQNSSKRKVLSARCKNQVSKRSCSNHVHP